MNSLIEIKAIEPGTEKTKKMLINESEVCSVEYHIIRTSSDNNPISVARLRMSSGDTWFCMEPNYEQWHNDVIKRGNT